MIKKPINQAVQEAIEQRYKGTLKILLTQLNIHPSEFKKAKFLEGKRVDDVDVLFYEIELINGDKKIWAIDEFGQQILSTIN